MPILFLDGWDVSEENPPSPTDKLQERFPVKPILEQYLKDHGPFWAGKKVIEFPHWRDSIPEFYINETIGRGTDIRRVHYDETQPFIYFLGSQVKQARKMIRERYKNKPGLNDMIRRAGIP